MEDRALMEDYLTKQSNEAFAELVNRHVALVYSTALRITGQPALAEDIAQNVFVRLARLAATIRDGNALPGWLYRTTCHTAYNTLRAEKRRRENETAAMQITEMIQDSRAAWERLAPLLDEGMARLSDSDQNIVIQRFFEGRSLREVGEALGLSDDAAQKRVHRALEKLREYFVKNGIAVPAAMLAPSLSNHAIHAAPACLAPKIAAAAPPAAAAGGGFAFLKLLILMSQTKIKAALVAAFFLLLSGSIGWSIWVNIQASKNAGISSKGAVALPTLSSSAQSPLQSGGRLSSASASSNRVAAQSSLADAYDLVADKNTATDHAAYARKLAIAILSYAQDHQMTWPADTSVVNGLIDGETKGYLFTMAIQGSLKSLKNPTTTLMLKEDSFPLPDGRWARSYVYTDGHVETATSDTNDFSEWEHSHNFTGANP